MFGDIFEAPHFFDVHLRGDSRRLAFADFPAKAPLSGTFYAAPSEKLPLQGEVVLAYGRSGRELPGRESRHTTDLPGRAILLSDDCHVPTAYGDRPGRSRARGRLLFAPIVSVDEDELAKVAEGTTFARFALPREGLLPDGGVAELRRTFLVAATAVEPAARLASLDEGGRKALERRWNAFACRRGPEASWENVVKLARLASGGENPPPAHRDAAQALWQVLDLAWELEGSTMRKVSETLEASAAPEPALSRVREDLRGLIQLGEAALTRLEALEDDPTNISLRR